MKNTGKESLKQSVREKQFSEEPCGEEKEKKMLWELALSFLIVKSFSTFYYRPVCRILEGCLEARSGLWRSTWPQNWVVTLLV